VAGIINFAHALDIPLIAEGVETAEQATILQELGCDMAQGWLYGKALANDRLHSEKRSHGLCA
jgi:EAL domain-containing protein (putative c-di-GMP-specific phosphodiesterase class I)